MPAPFYRGGQNCVSHQVLFMTTIRLERAGVSFGVGRQGGPVAIEIHTHHDTISTLRGIQVSFELLNGITPAQAKKLVEVLNENVVGMLVTTASDDQTKAAAVSEVAAKV
jgi:hypothetical protein